MQDITWMPHQLKILDKAEKYKNNGIFVDMGLGKTFIGAELLYFNATKKSKSLIVCQISKIDDWQNHIAQYYEDDFADFNLRNKLDFNEFLYGDNEIPYVGIINYDLIFRRPELKTLNLCSVLLDESSIIKNSNFKKLSKRTRFFLDIKESVKHFLLLSGTPTNGKYEKLVSQMNLLGWDISEETFYKHYVDYAIDMEEGHPIVKINGYKRVARLKNQMADYGCIFLTSEEAGVNPPQQNDQKHYTKPHSAYWQFVKKSIIEIDGKEIVGDTSLTKRLYERTLCGSYSIYKKDLIRDILLSTDKRALVFYNFNEELFFLRELCIELEKPFFECNGHKKNYTDYMEYENSIILIQYQSGAKGIDLQAANQTIYFTPPESSEDFEQSKKRTHRVGQNAPCFYHYLICKNTIEERIYAALAQQKDYTDELFRKENEKNGYYNY